MKIHFHKNFNRQYKKLNASQKLKTKQRIKIFLDDPFNPILNNHPLKGKYTDYRSINITGDLRAIYKNLNTQEIIFVKLGNHSQLYS
ncbi:type II toxin-antitoxin system mRNA interferase toxin, RelE/StbE family [Candidatus Kuenenbacteria bacterium]|nr:type II toxin-antitoxin system mRNA interferase toxin, RelE/StbE family [Candidatus Kuenenbacteria bacterium]